MNEFMEPTIEVVTYEKEDIVTASGCGTSYAGGYDKCTSGRSPSLVS